MGDESSDAPLLAVEDLRTHIETDRGRLRAVDGVSLAVGRGEAVCLVGESGSGKSVTCESLTGIVPQPPATIAGGEITFDGIDLRAEDTDLGEIRGARIGHVFQNPQHALDPVYAVGEQLVEAITAHRDVSDRAARERAVELLRQVGIPRADVRVDDYPHEFSGGMAQRVAIAIALAGDPDLLIADEPTTAVDVTVQARLIDLLDGLLDDGMALLLVTHDLRVAAALADRVLAMFGGTVVERGPVERVFERPAHPYTQALFESYDGFEQLPDRPSRAALPTDGCRFRAECPHEIEACTGGERPPFAPVDGDAGHAAACVYYGDGRDATVVRDGGRAAGPNAEGDDDD